MELHGRSGFCIRRRQDRSSGNVECVSAVKIDPKGRKYPAVKAEVLNGKRMVKLTGT